MFDLGKHGEDGHYDNIPIVVFVPYTFMVIFVFSIC